MTRLHPQTPRQLAVLEALEALTRETGHPPSAQAVADRLGVSRQAATKVLGSLERQGLIRDVPVLVRSGKWRVLTE